MLTKHIKEITLLHGLLINNIHSSHLPQLTYKYKIDFCLSYTMGIGIIFNILEFFGFPISLKD